MLAEGSQHHHRPAAAHLCQSAAGLRGLQEDQSRALTAPLRGGAEGLAHELILAQLTQHQERE